VHRSRGFDLLRRPGAPAGNPVADGSRILWIACVENGVLREERNATGQGGLLRKGVMRSAPAAPFHLATLPTSDSHYSCDPSEHGSTCGGPQPLARTTLHLFSTRLLYVMRRTSSAHISPEGLQPFLSVSGFEECVLGGRPNLHAQRRRGDPEPAAAWFACHGVPGEASSSGDLEVHTPGKDHEAETSL
jgi:hypothetical protein